MTEGTKVEYRLRECAVQDQDINNMEYNNQQIHLSKTKACEDRYIDTYVSQRFGPPKKKMHF
jgi:hypothetical protein